MYIEVNTIIMAASLLTAVVAIFSAVFAVYRWYLKQNKQDAEIEKMKAEQCLLTYGILACLKGLKEQGCNGPVTEAIDISTHTPLAGRDPYILCFQYSHMLNI